MAISDNDPRQAEIRGLLRIIGPVVTLVGLVFAAIGIGNFFFSMGSFGIPRYFWCAFVGLPLVGLGAAMTKFAYIGSISRYMAGEVAPVGKDVVNYLADGTQAAVRTVASSLREGYASPVAQQRCVRCEASNESDSQYCKACGAPLLLKCSACGEAVAPDARFCDHCGISLASAS